MKIPAQREAAVENKTKKEITERIRLHIEGKEMSVGYCHATTLTSLLPHIEHISLITSLLKITAVAGSEKGSKLR